MRDVLVQTVTQALALPPRATVVLAEVAELVPRVYGLLDRIELTRATADLVFERLEVTRVGADRFFERLEATRSAAALSVERLEATRAAADLVVEGLAARVEQSAALLTRLEAIAATLQPVAERVAALGPQAVDDGATLLAELRGLGPDAHALVDTSRELYELLGHVPGMGRARKRVEEERTDPS